MPQPVPPLAADLPLSNTAISQLLLRFQATAIPLVFWLKPVFLAIAFAWLIYRAYNVLSKPLDELAALLGFDIPLTPRIDVAGIKADGAIVNWTLPQKQKHKSTLRFDIHLNGTVIDSVAITETAVTISGLQPSSSYVVRVALVNHLDFSSRSAPIRFRTKSASSGDFFLPLAQRHDADHDGSSDTLPRVRHYRGLKDVLPASVQPTPMVREGSVGLSSKRASTGRRLSPANAAATDGRTEYEESEPYEGFQTVQQLTERLDAIRREIDDIEGMAKDEEEEELRLKDELAKERDDLKAEVTEKEKASRNLKREVNMLERQNTAAQNERTKQEKLLQQKKQERQKLQDGMVRWEKEAADMKADLERIRLEKTSYLEQIEQAKDALRLRHTDETTTMRTLDDEIREKTAEIKKLERQMKNDSPDGTDAEPSLVQQFQQDAEEDRQYATRRTQLNQQYALAFQKLDAVKVFHADQVRFLESLRAASRRQEEFSAHHVPASPVPAERLPRRGDSQRSRHNTNAQSSDSPRIATFATTTGPFGSGIPSIAPFGGSGPFLNIHNGMTIPGPTDDMNMAEEDRERLTGGALMSPGAGVDLLPTDLFSGDGERHTAQRVSPLPGLGALPGLPGIPTAPAQSTTDLGPASPTSNSSRSPSVFASPRTSSHNLQLGSPDHVVLDSDRRSIRSNRSNRATSGGAQSQGSRFSSIFGIKQKSKASADDALGLGKVQSHSMPRQDGNLIGIDNARKRNSSISGFGSDGVSEAMKDVPAVPRKNAFGAFFDRHKNDDWPSTFTSFGRRPASPRPGSTHSTELPRPSVDSNRWGVDTWPSGDASAGSRGSPLSFGLGFGASAAQQRLFGSRHPSRRPSVQYGGTGPPEDILEDDSSDTWDTPGKRKLAPIGTRPATGSQKEADDSAAARLNPAAKDFKSLFSSRRGKDKSKGDKSTLSTPVAGLSSRDFEADDSPPNSRKSRDTRSITGSSVAESGRNSQELVRTPSYSNSLDATAASPHVGSTGKESFMAKITRKSSSSKFSLPTFKREKGRLDPSSAASSPAIPPPTTEDEEDSLSASMSSLRERDTRESKESTRGSGRNWSSVLKLGKSKKGNETPSLSSMASADDDDDET